MPDRSKLLVHLRRLSQMFQWTFTNGPEGIINDKWRTEQPDFIHYGCAYYLLGCLAFLEGGDGSYSWNKASVSDSDFDTFAARYPVAPKQSYAMRGINKTSMDALACIRNAVAHHDGELSKNRDSQCMSKVLAANLPGVTLVGNVVKLEEAFLEFVRVATLAARNYHGEF
jgi:hypothetical protein